MPQLDSARAAQVERSAAHWRHLRRVELNLANEQTGRRARWWDGPRAFVGVLAGGIVAALVIGGALTVAALTIVAIAGAIVIGVAE